MSAYARFQSVMLILICSISSVPRDAQSATAANAATLAPAEPASQNETPRKAKAKVHKKKEHTPPDAEADNEGDPSTNDLIGATIQAANAEAAMPPNTHVCTPADVAAHGRCQFVGQRYRMPFNCPPAPTDYKAWHVASVGDDVWATSAAGRSWHLTKTSGKAKQAGQSFRVSRFAFDVHADNPCAR
jgi:hypothetical protein